MLKLKRRNLLTTQVSLVMMSTVPTGIALLIAVSSGLVSAVLTAILAPLVTSGLQQRNWRCQKHFELKYQAFQSAIAAINAYAADAMDAELQSNRKAYKGLVRSVEMRPETDAALSSAKGIVQAFFSEQTYALYDEAQRTEISFDTIPNCGFESAKTHAITAMAEELGIRSIKGRRGLGLSRLLERMKRWAYWEHP